MLDEVMENTNAICLRKHLCLWSSMIETLLSFILEVFLTQEGKGWGQGILCLWICRGDFNLTGLCIVPAMIDIHILQHMWQGCSFLLHNLVFIFYLIVFLSYFIFRKSKITCFDLIKIQRVFNSIYENWRGVWNKLAILRAYNTYLTSPTNQRITQLTYITN